jgi:hypothetical protein
MAYAQTCPNCQAGMNRQHILAEGKRQCTVCATIWTLTEHGPTLLKQGDVFLAEISPHEKLI